MGGDDKKQEMKIVTRREKANQRERNINMERERRRNGKQQKESKSSQTKTIVKDRIDIETGTQ